MKKYLFLILSFCIIGCQAQAQTAQKFNLGFEKHSDKNALADAWFKFGGKEVNPNTVMRSYECLQTQGIIYNKRGVGFFVAIDADKQIAEARQKEFVEIELPNFCQRMKSLGIPLERFISEYEK